MSPVEPDAEPTASRSSDPAVEETPPEGPAPLRLHALGGAEAPFDTSFDLREVRLLPASAKKELWRVLGPSLPEPIPDGTGRKLETFASRHRVPRERLARAIRACRFLLREAARRDLPADLFLHDLSRLLEESDSDVHVVLGSGYDRAKSAVRHEILAGAIGDHGSLLLGVDWRVDTVNVSHRGAGLESRVAFLTLRYMEGEEKRRLTLQALPDVVKELREACDTVLEW